MSSDNEAVQQVEIWQKVLAGSEVKEYPEKKVQAYYEDNLRHYKELAEDYGYENFDDYVKHEYASDTESFQNQLREYAKSQVFDVSKTLEGRSFTEDDSFSFTLSGTGIATPYTLTLNKDHQSGSFPAVEFDEPGTYTYTIREDLPLNPDEVLEGVVYDTAVYAATVVISDNGEGGFDKTVTYKKGNGAEQTYNDDTTAFAFVNNYYKPDNPLEEPSNEVEIIIADESTDVPETGDETNMLLWLMMLVASGMGLQRTVVYRRKKM